MRFAIILSFLLTAVPALAADRAAAQASYQQGNEAFDQGKFSDAATAFGQATEQDPQFQEAYYNRALADEMVDRQKAIAEWKQFAQLAASAADFKYQVGQANARIQILELLPAYPEALQPTHYVASASDYYRKSLNFPNRGNGIRFPSRWPSAMCRSPTGRKERARHSTSGRRCFRWNWWRNLMKRIFASIGRLNRTWNAASG